MTTSSALDKTELFYKKLIEDAYCGIVILSIDGNIMDSNAHFEKMTDFNKAQLKGTRFADLFLPKYQNEFNEKLRSLSTTINMAMSEIYIKRNDERVLPIELNGNIVKMSSETVVMLLVNEVSQKNKNLRQDVLQDRLAATSSLAAGIAHEINNPAAYIYMNMFYIKEELERIKSELPENSDKSKQLETINEVIDKSINGLERITKVIKNLRGFTRTDEFDLTEADIHEILDAAINVIATEIKTRAKLIKVYTALNTTLVCNRGKLQQMFTYILLNALQAIPPDQPDKNTITVTTENRSDGIRIDISDTGRGIADADIPRLFDAFYTTKFSEGGKGLGLFLCYDIVRNHNGEVLINSLGEKGTVVSVFLPIRRKLK